MWLASVLRDQALDFRFCAFANTLKNPAGMKKKPRKVYILRNIFILIQLGVGLQYNAIITELDELWKGGSTF